MSYGSRPLWEMLTGVWLLGSLPKPASLNGLVVHFQAVNPRTGMQRDTNCSDQGSHVYSEYGIRKINKNKKRREKRTEAKRSEEKRREEKRRESKRKDVKKKGYDFAILAITSSQCSFTTHRRVHLNVITKSSTPTASSPHWRKPSATPYRCWPFVCAAARYYLAQRKGINFHCF